MPAALTYSLFEGFILQTMIQGTGMAMLECTQKVLAPVQIAAPIAPHPSVPAARARSTPSSGRRGGLIEIDLPGERRVRVDAQFDAAALSRVLDLLESR